MQKLKLALGVMLLAAGAAGTLLPIVPGVPILLVGVALIGCDHPLVRKMKTRLQLWQTKIRR
jgi:uncharacterized protein YqgC (DUF456 family)